MNYLILSRKGKNLLLMILDASLSPSLSLIKHWVAGAKTVNSSETDAAKSF